MRDIVEIVYFITAGPVLALLAGVGLWQLVLAKRTLDASRESVEQSRKEAEQRTASDRMRLSVDMCIRFAEHVVPLIQEADELVKRHPLPQVSAGKDIWNSASYSELWKSGWRTKTNVKTVLRALNSMEAIAFPFAHDAADRDVARESIGNAFVEAATRFAFVIAKLGETPGCGSFPATRTLCESWTGPDGECA